MAKAIFRKINKPKKKKKAKLEESGSLSSDYTIRLPHQNSMPLTQKWTYSSMEQIKSRNKPIHL